jgi:signal transduction histidine kinase
MALFRIVQEALTNALRHARASEVRIVAREDRGDVRVAVIDNGRGIRQADLARANAFGLIGMQERALACGGEVTFERPERGTRVVVRLTGASANASPDSR